jgi:hypothetical protein
MSECEQHGPIAATFEALLIDPVTLPCMPSCVHSQSDNVSRRAMAGFVAETGSSDQDPSRAGIPMHHQALVSGSNPYPNFLGPGLASGFSTVAANNRSAFKELVTRNIRSGAQVALSLRGLVQNTVSERRGMRIHVRH